MGPLSEGSSVLLSILEFSEPKENQQDEPWQSEAGDVTNHLSNSLPNYFAIEYN